MVEIVIKWWLAIVKIFLTLRIWLINRIEQLSTQHLNTDIIDD